MSTRIRCAIYTRKSSDDGLEQEFNSLDAQREACESFIASQRGLGWIALPARYDDGGLSGGTLERPALQSLLVDIGAGKVDLVVVYKVDRLTRSLADFAKIVEVFDAAGVSFVSVTQQFNTSTSMGRLTLNMLLSFAQFEREVTGERIRDKIAASKRKGMWMGGLPPLGYEVRDKKLVVDHAEAATVRSLFRLYLELGTVAKLLDESKRLGLLTKRRSYTDGRQSGGLPFTRGNLYQLLSNPLYAGEVAHRGASYPGQHESIVDRATFEAVRQRLTGNATQRRSATNAIAPSLLTGLVYDGIGERLCPTHANKKGRRYRYYISKRLMHRSASDETGLRLPAKALENAVVGAIGDFLRDELRIVDALQLGNPTPGRMRYILHGAAAIASELKQAQPERQRVILHRLMQRVELAPESLRFELKRSDLMQLIDADETRHDSVPDGPIDFSIPVLLRRRGVEAKLLLRTPAANRPAPDKKLVALMRRAHLWLNQMTAGEVDSVGAVAARANLHASDVGRCLQLAFLAPDIVAAILDGHQPIELTTKRLSRIGALPLSWEMQRRLLGFAA